MGQGTTEVRRGIERTRDDMSETINAIADRTSPSRVVGRQRRRVADRFRSMRERVMGTADDIKASAQDTGHSAVQSTQHGAEQLAETVRELPGQARDQVRTQTAGNPLAAGLIAFGGGLLAAYVLPSSRVEHRAASQVRETAEPAIQELKETGREVAEGLEDTATQAADEVKQAASATETVGDQARQASNEVRR